MSTAVPFLHFLSGKQGPHCRVAVTKHYTEAVHADSKATQRRKKSKRLPHKVVIDRTQWLCPRCFRLKELEMTYIYTQEKVHHFRDLATLQRWSVKKRFTTVPGPLWPCPQACVTPSRPAVPAVLRTTKSDSFISFSQLQLY